MPESRRSARDAARANASTDSVDALFADPGDGGDGSGGSAASRPRKKRRLWGWWVVLGVFLVLVGVGVTAVLVGPQIADRAVEAADELEKAVPIASTLQQQIVDGDTEGAAASVDQMEVHTSAARELTDDGLWRTFEWVPWVGENLSAVRKSIAAADDLVVGVARPATTLSIDALRPVDGRIDLEQLAEVQAIVDDAYGTIEEVSVSLDSIDREAVIPQVRRGVQRLDDVMALIEPYFEPLDRTLTVLPAALGADGPRSYLVLVQNNAESRSTGGNPAALMRVTAEDGVITMARQAHSGEFRNLREEPIIPLQEGTGELYGENVGEWIQDVTMTPDFTESADIVQAFWAETFDTPVDAVISTDPVALARLLDATGPVTLPTGEKLTGGNAVKVLLSDVYKEYTEDEYDAIFAAAASAVFAKLTSGDADPRALLAAVADSVADGRILYVPADEAEAEYLAGSRILGDLPEDNTTDTVLGAYVNDRTEGKLDFYLDTAVNLATDACEAEGDATFDLSYTLDYVLDPADVPGLTYWESTARFFPKGDLNTNVVLYGPPGSTLQTVTVDGTEVEGTRVEHLGRPAVRVNVDHHPGDVRTIEATFRAPQQETWGTLDVWTTPMVRDTPVTFDAPGCEVAGE